MKISIKTQDRVLTATLIDNEMTKDFIRGALRPGATSYLATDLQC
jgi:hypothetical protein